MFFSVARLRPLLPSFLLLLLPFAHAHQDSIFTSSVSYCAPPESILIEQFDVAYFPANSSIVFNVSAASVSHINVTASLLVNVYGMAPFNISIDLCSLFGGGLCPLPVYNFTGADTISLPSSLDLTSHIPGIAYKIPDLEAFAQLMLMEVGTGDVKACVQSTLSNGWSAHQYAVEWTTASMALVALASAIWHSIVGGPLALAPIRLLDILYLFQTIAVSGLLSLNYPSVYRAYALNFAWAIGLFSAVPTSPIQESINRMRHMTGGDLANATSGGAVPLVNRKLSPYNDVSYLVPQSLLNEAAALPRINFVNLAAVAGNSSAAVARSTSELLVGGNVATVTQESDNVLQAGVPIFTNFIGIATANAFMTIFLITLILLAIVLASLGLGYLTVLGLGRTHWAKERPGFHRFKADYPAFARAWGLRIALLCSLPVLTFAFYQWTLKDSWLSILLRVRPPPTVLQALLDPDSPPSLSVVPLTAPYQPHRVYYIIALITALLVKALVIAFAKPHGLVQAIIFLVLEVLLFGALVVMKPYRTRRADVFMGFLVLVRLVCSGLLIAFAESLGVAAIPRVVIGIVTAVIFSVTVLIVFANVLVNLGLWRLVRRLLPCGRRRRAGEEALSSHASGSSSDSVAEKGESGKEKKAPGKDEESVTITTDPPQYYYRPGNPSPPTSASLTPVSPESHQPSMYSTSTETTLGEPLPRRWSLQYSRPPSVSESSPQTPFYLRGRPCRPHHPPQGTHCPHNDTAGISRRLCRPQ
ncbi:putative flavin carrier protein 3 [Grifola frondosa]|uniref:Putative flavin carrier protein 3 n=1 Tax=Grifola frondosa TaxID=5627 RepID=A0A1C7LTY2_GRIFR|nr:putative flavin carrier protein 3 [Grifola frondosa]